MTPKGPLRGIGEFFAQGIFVAARASSMTSRTTNSFGLLSSVGTA
jgi:hypothetical protein